MRIALKIAYDGCHFHGFARQPNLPTIEGTLLEFLTKQQIIHSLKHAQFRYASRTDKKVSALGNVIAFNTTIHPEKILQQANKLQNTIILYATAIVEDTFFPRYATHRHYRYYLKKTNHLNQYQLQSTLNLFIGTHNYSNFARIEPGKNPVREITNITCTEQNQFFLIDFYAPTFLWNQIRRIIAAALTVAEGKTTNRTVQKALQQPHIKTDFRLAPAEPLILMDVGYPFEFNINSTQYHQIPILEQTIQNSLLKKPN